MKTIKLKLLIIFTLLIYSSEVFSQKESVITYYPHNITIEYFENNKNNSDIFILEHISELQFIDNSIIRVYSGKDTFTQINITG